MWQLAEGGGTVSTALAGAEEGDEVVMGGGGDVSLP